MTVKGNGTRKLPCLIASFAEYLETVGAPKLFAKWGAISMVSGAMGRSIWSTNRRGIYFANLFVLLVGPPGCGKGMTIEPLANVWAGANLKVAPTSMTKAAFLDKLNAAGKFNRALEANIKSLLIPSPEFGVLVPQHDTTFLNVLNAIYDNPPIFIESRRSADDVRIEYPNISIIGGTQPKFLASLLPEGAYGMGFMSRIILIYAYRSPIMDFFDEMEYDHTMIKMCSEDIRVLGKMAGQLPWTREAKERLNEWTRADCPIKPMASRLQDYNARRPMHVAKLSMTKAMARASKPHEVQRRDVQWAIDTLLEAEQLMPEVFNEMLGDADWQHIENLFAWIVQRHMSAGKPIRESEVMAFCTKVAGLQKAQWLFRAAIDTGTITNDPTLNTTTEGLRQFIPGVLNTRI